MKGGKYSKDKIQVEMGGQEVGRQDLHIWAIVSPIFNVYQSLFSSFGTVLRNPRH